MLCVIYYIEESFLMYTWWQFNSNSLTQECEGHTLSTKKLRSHVTGVSIRWTGLDYWTDL